MSIEVHKNTSLSFLCVRAFDALSHCNQSKSAMKRQGLSQNLFWLALFFGLLFGRLFPHTFIRTICIRIQKRKLLIQRQAATRYHIICVDFVIEEFVWSLKPGKIRETIWTISSRFWIFYFLPHASAYYIITLKTT